MQKSLGSCSLSWVKYFGFLYSFVDDAYPRGNSRPKLRKKCFAGYFAFSHIFQIVLKLVQSSFLCSPLFMFKISSSLLTQKK